MSRHSRPRQLVSDARFGFVKAVFFELFSQVIVGHVSPLQLGLDVPRGPFGPFPLSFGKAHVLPRCHIRIYVIITDNFVLTRGGAMILYPVSNYRMRCRHEPSFPRSANPGHRLSDRRHEHSGHRATDRHPSGHHHAPWGADRARLCRAARPDHGWSSGRPDRNGRTVGVRWQEAAASKAHRQPREGRPIHVRCLGLIVPRHHRLPHRQAEWRRYGPIHSGLARPGDRLAGNLNGWLLALPARHPRCVPGERPWRHQQDFQRHSLSPYGPSASSLLASGGYRGCEGSGARRAGANQHVLCGAQQPFDPHGEPTLYPADQRIQQEAGQSSVGGRPVCGALQSVPRSRVAFAERSQPSDASDGVGHRGSAVVAWRVDRRGASGCHSRSDRNCPGAASQVSRDRRRPLVKTKPGNGAGFRQSTAMTGEQPPSHHGNAVTGTLGRAYTSKTEVELSGPRAEMRTHMLITPVTPTSVREDIHRFRFGPMPTHGSLLSALREHTPRMAPGRRGPAGQQKGIASDGEFYRSSVLTEGMECPNPPELGQNPKGQKNILRTENKSCTLLPIALCGARLRGLAFATFCARLGVRCRLTD